MFYECERGEIGSVLMGCEELQMLIGSWGFVCLVLAVRWSKNLVNDCCRKKIIMWSFFILTIGRKSDG